MKMEGQGFNSSSSYKKYYYQRTRDLELSLTAAPLVAGKD